MVKRTNIVGIINVTPDSFSGDGMLGIAYDKIGVAIDALIEQGVDVIDIGAESTRPNAILVSPEEEWKRLEPLMPFIDSRIPKCRFSLDTRYTQTALNFIVSLSRQHISQLLLNDVSGGAEKEMVELAGYYHIPLILTHSLTVPANPNITLSEDKDVMQVLMEWGSKVKKNHPHHALVLDPGIGFGKTNLQSLHIIKHIALLISLGLPVMVGHSRKSFISRFTPKLPLERDPETVLFSSYMAKKGVDYLRVHDVRSHIAMLKINDYL